MAGLFVGLGFWQLARNTHKHNLVAQARAAYAAPAPDVTTIGAGRPDGSRVEASGTFDGAHETVLRNQVRGGRAGVDVLTPLRMADGTTVLVDRGWVHASASGGLTTDPPPTGKALVHGLLHSSNPLAAADSVDHLADGRIAVPRVDLGAIGRTLGYRLLPVWIEARAIEPTPSGGAPSLPQPPAPDPVNHMQYAIEWFAFALIPIIGWPIALRRLLRQRKAVTTSATASTESTQPVPKRNDRAGSRESNP
jgi:cytochrome oxidase assembly protein ShyY1